MKRAVTLLFLLALALWMTACSSPPAGQAPTEAAGEPGAVPTSDAAGAPEAYPAEVVPLPEQSGYPQPEASGSTDASTSAYPAPYSPETSTGIEAIDRVIAALQSADPAALQGLMSFAAAPCTNADGLGGPPKCAPGEAEGTQVEGLPVWGPEGHYMRKSEMTPEFLPGPFDLIAVYTVKEGAVQDTLYPSGQYGVVLEQTHADGFSSYVTLRITDSGIVRVDFDVDIPGASFPEAGEFILPVQ